jgi:hypothetical protein
MTTGQHDGIPIDQPATVLWGHMGENSVTERHDFGRLDEALVFIASELPIGARHTAWVISGGRLVAPEHVPELIGKIAAQIGPSAAFAA